MKLRFSFPHRFKEPRSCKKLDAQRVTSGDGLDYFSIETLAPHVDEVVKPVSSQTEGPDLVSWPCPPFNQQGRWDRPRLPLDSKNLVGMNPKEAATFKDV